MAGNPGGFPGMVPLEVDREGPVEVPSWKPFTQYIITPGSVSLTPYSPTNGVKDFLSLQSK